MKDHTFNARRDQLAARAKKIPTADASLNRARRQIAARATAHRMAAAIRETGDRWYADRIVWAMVGAVLRDDMAAYEILATSIE